jgi:lipoprotein-releasing system permease protein
MATMPFAPVEWLIAGRYLRAKKQTGFVSVITLISFIGIALGVATLIIVMSVMNGFRHELLSTILGVNGHINVVSYTGITDYEAAAERLLQVPGVTRAAPIIEGQVMAAANGKSTGALVRGIAAKDLANFDIVASTLSENALDRFSGSAVIIGRRLADSFGLEPGNNITLIAPKGDVTIFGTIPRSKSYKIAGTFKVGMSDFDAGYIFMPLDESQLYFGTKGTVQGIEMKVANPDAIEEMEAPVAAAAPEATRVISWKEKNTTFFSALMVERNVMFLILSLIIMVAALNTVSGLIMLVKDKGRDIAILRTMGTSQGSIMRVFFMAGSAIGVAGTVLGLTLGILFCLNIEDIRQFVIRTIGFEVFSPEVYFLSHMPAKMDPNEVITVGLMSLALSFLATLYPAWSAARVDPVEALRYE